MKEGNLSKPKNGCLMIFGVLMGAPALIGLIIIPIAILWAGVDLIKAGRIVNGLVIFLMFGGCCYAIYKFIKWKSEKGEFSRVKPTENSIELNTKNGKLLLNNPFRGFFVVGAAGSGKSESIAIPLLNQFIDNDFTGIVYDFKFPTLANDVNTFLSKKNTNLRHYFLNFNNPYQSCRVNPLNPMYLPNTSYAREYAQAIISNLMPESIKKPDFWSRSATDLLTACIWFLKEERPDICDLPHVLAMITSPDVALLEKLQQNPTTQQMTISIYNAMERGADSQVSGVIGTLQGVIAQINTPELMYIFGADEFSLDINNPNNPTILTVGNYPTLKTTLAPLCSLVITVATKLMNQPNKQKSFVLLDEAPTIFIPNIEILPNTGRSNRIATILMCQDLAQLTDGYGKEKADVLFASCNNHFYGRVSSSHTSEILSKQFGKIDKTYISTSINRKNTAIFRSTSGQSESVQERDYIKSSEFLKFGVGEFASITVESNKPILRTNYRRVETPMVMLNLADRSGDIYLYYKKVRSDIEDLLKKADTTGSYDRDNAKLNETKRNLFELD